jgi:hypothetical protein
MILVRTATCNRFQIPDFTQPKKSARHTGQELRTGLQTRAMSQAR